MKGLCVKSCGILLCACLLGSAQAATLAERADALLLDMLGAVGAVRDYEARFVVQAQVDGRLVPPETLLIKHRRDPSCLYMRWLDGERQSRERTYCSGEAAVAKTVRTRGRTLMNRKQLTQAQMRALQVVLRPVDDDGLYGLVARYASQYFDAAQNAQPDDFVVEVRQATVFKRPATCLRIRRRALLLDAPFQGQNEICVDDRSKLPSAFRVWNAEGVLLESYLMGDYRINSGLKDADFKLVNEALE